MKVTQKEEQDNKIKKLEDTVADLANLVKASLNHKADTKQNTVDPQQRKKELDEKLKRSLQ